MASSCRVRVWIRSPLIHFFTLRVGHRGARSTVILPGASSRERRTQAFGPPAEGPASWAAHSWRGTRGSFCGVSARLLTCAGASSGSGATEALGPAHAIPVVPPREPCWPCFLGERSTASHPREGRGAPAWAGKCHQNGADLRTSRKKALSMPTSVAGSLLERCVIWSFPAVRPRDWSSDSCTRQSQVSRDEARGVKLCPGGREIQQE